MSMDPQGQPPPIQQDELLRDLLRRSIRTETRLAKLMQHFGLHPQTGAHVLRADERTPATSLPTAITLKENDNGTPPLA